MRYNLKNRPKPDEKCEWACYDVIEKWFVGFERELREKFGEKEGKDPIWLASQVRKEVLGE